VLIAVPEQQVAIRQMRRMQSRGLSLREIAAAMKAAGVPISHMSVKNVLDAASAGAAAGLIEGRHVYVQDVPPRRLSHGIDTPTKRSTASKNH
jgi:hypothetical protein